MGTEKSAVTALTVKEREKVYQEAMSLFEKSAKSADLARHQAAAALYNVERFGLYEFEAVSSMRDYFRIKNIPERTGYRYIAEARQIVEAAGLGDDTPLTDQHVAAWCEFRRQLKRYNGDPQLLLAANNSQEESEEADATESHDPELRKLMAERFAKMSKPSKPIKPKVGEQAVRNDSIARLQGMLETALSESSALFVSVKGFGRSEASRRRVQYLLLLIWYYVNEESQLDVGDTLEFIPYDEAERMLTENSEELELRRPDVHAAISEASRA